MTVPQSAHHVSTVSSMRSSVHNMRLVTSIPGNASAPLDSVAMIALNPSVDRSRRGPIDHFDMVTNVPALMDGKA